MIADLKPYAEYKESGLPWVGRVPGHWDSRRLRHACDMRVSNVDKHTKLGETPVRLCNYVEVYKSERILESTRFMAATASEDERVRFGLRKGDVLITKDSEQWNDIGVPALVECEAPDLVCGYHLAILRARPGLHGAFLHRALESHLIAAQFHVEANGVTRYGLSHGAIQGVAIPLPPPAEQAAIVRFLDWANGRLERAIRAKRKVIALLQEQKQAIIHRAVTRGLDPNVPLKPSGIDWTSYIPQDWEQYPLRRLAMCDNSGSYGDEPGAGLQELPVATTAQITQDGRFNVDRMPRRGFTAAEVERFCCKPGDILVVKSSGSAANVISGKCGIVGSGTPPFVYSNFLARFVANATLVKPRYLFLLLTSYITRERVKRMVSTTTYPNLRMGEYRGSLLPVPPIEQQQRILNAVSAEVASLDLATIRLEREIELLREYRTRLVADVVTGKLDVREAATRLPAEAPIDAVEDDADPAGDLDSAVDEAQE
jgi:type I restriction enzyme, S subunit